MGPYIVRSRDGNRPTGAVVMTCKHKHPTLEEAIVCKKQQPVFVGERVRVERVDKQSLTPLERALVKLGVNKPP